VTFILRLAVTDELGYAFRPTNETVGFNTQKHHQNENRCLRRVNADDRRIGLYKPSMVRLSRSFTSMEFLGHSAAGWAISEEVGLL